MAFLMSPKEFTRRNIRYGEEGTEKRRRELAGYAGILQELKDQGALGLLESAQRFERPEQEARITGLGAETERTRLGTAGEEFYQGLSRRFAEPFMKKYLGMEDYLPEPERAELLSRERGPVPASIGPRTDIATPRGPGVTGTWEAPKPPTPSILDRFSRMFAPRKKKLARDTAVLGVRG